MSAAILAKVYREVCQGFSKGKFLNKVFFFKHFTSLDFCRREEIYEKELKESLSRGLPLKKEREADIVRLGLWGEKDERKIESLDKAINSLKPSLEKARDSIQKDQVLESIKGYELEKLKIFNSKERIIGITADDVASKRASEELVAQNTYLDEGFSQNLFQEEDYEYLSAVEKQLFEYEIWENVLKHFTQENLKKIAFKAYFLRPFSITKENFFQKRGVELTNWQIDLLNYGEYAEFILQKVRGKSIPDEILEDPDKIEGWIKDEELKEQVAKESSQLSRNLDRAFKMGQ